ncbi:Bestrophin, RFP-TM, chloride channel-domain-containing protein [Gymnopilus junonius]|uniref:Bestrophin, RFP-TM, chloride channel-domain-containing protein n=1 Tax=Gymnopilus junonius TaxID=109634 RepID=A0A9P5TQ65_GYMJU|nr:Bestrophin, RFP-TM, chloride channel-domain-containing protein [Gymnopilus junonius]
MSGAGTKNALSSVLPTIRAPTLKRAHLRKVWAPSPAFPAAIANNFYAVFMASRCVSYQREPRIIGPVLTVTIFSALVCYASQLGYRLVMMNSIVPLLSVVVGLILVFRTSYDRYWEGRKAFAALTANTRNISRLIWINVTLPPTDEQPAFAKGKTPTTNVTAKQLKRRKTDALHLCLSFVFAAKHYLRGEDGVNYADYQGVFPASFARFDEVGYNTQQTTASEIYSATGNSREGSRSASGTVSPDPRHRPDATKRVRPKRSKQHVTDHSTPLLHDFQRSVEFHPFADQASLPLPLVIAHELSRTIFSFRRDGFLETVGPAGLNGLTQMISGLVDHLTAMERVANTPIPVSCEHQLSTSDIRLYVVVDSIHLKQCVTLYLFALPMTLVHDLGWATVPVVTLVAFTFMGIEGIADEIEQPFGNDQRDLPLDRYCQDLKEEVYYIIERLPEGGEGIHGYDDGEGDD